MAIGFGIAGMVKIFGERFASGLSAVHPMGAYLEALHHTGYYYTFIGWAQLLAAILLLIPRTVLLGAMLYLPIIGNIFVLSMAVRFDGSYVTSPFMLLANLFILFWHYNKLKALFVSSSIKPGFRAQLSGYSKQFPWLFFTAVFSCVLLVIYLFAIAHPVMPRNSFKDCMLQFEEGASVSDPESFCACIHIEGKDLEACLSLYSKE